MDKERISENDTAGLGGRRKGLESKTDHTETQQNQKKHDMKFKKKTG